MPIPGNVVRVNLGFTYTADWPDEQSQNTFHLQSQSGPSGPTPDVQYIADQISGKFVTNWSAVAALYPSAVQLKTIKTTLLDSTGHAIAVGLHDATAAALNGTGSSGMLPPEVAVAMGLYAYTPGGFATQRGRKRGRMFLGPISQARVTDDGRFDLSAATGELAGWQTIINAINTIESASGRTDPMGVVILSVAGGATYEVLHLAWDDHFDAQRRRQHQDVATRATVGITAW